ncbi:exodeoxyribonuclease V subunit alpha [Nocardioides sp.]|uniref:exodeoxyribonuclease V subunit alpha n=1 Tax=Nocardioides sp. TaxID=35761 RepID=UPI00351626E1
MTELFEPSSVHDHRVARSASGLLGIANAAGLVESADVHVAERVAALAGEGDERVQLAVALAVRSVRAGSVGLDLTTLPALLAAPQESVDGPFETPVDGPASPATEALAALRAALPPTDEWRVLMAGSRLAAEGVVHVEWGLVYLDRYHRLECQVADDLAAREALGPPPVDDAELAATLERVSGRHLSGEQRAAVEHAVRHRTSVLTGGPGTGKTTTVARILVALADQFGAAHERPMAVALAAPTGKAATRLHEAVRAELGPEGLGVLAADGSPGLAAPEALTLHRLLGWRPDSTTRFVHDRSNRLKYDLVVVDEASMVDLTMIARLLEAVRPEARLVLVGDPRQLTSVGAGAVLSDLVVGLGARTDPPVASLVENHRSTEQIKDVAAALRGADGGAGGDGAAAAAGAEPDAEEAADAVLAALRAGTGEVTYLETDDPVEALRELCTQAALRVRRAALEEGPAAALTALESFRLLCAHREGPRGVRAWNRQTEEWLAAELGGPLGPFGTPWYAGRPLLVTSNDYTLDVYNGETGVVVPDERGRPRAWIAGAGEPRAFAPARLDGVETMHAMTIHKSQGSQAGTVVVLLPEAGSRVLTRELFYTALTRAQERVVVVGSEASVRAAVTTTARRATGLRQRLAAHP